MSPHRGWDSEAPRGRPARARPRRARPGSDAEAAGSRARVLHSVLDLESHGEAKLGDVIVKPRTDGQRQVQAAAVRPSHLHSSGAGGGGEVGAFPGAPQHAQLARLWPRPGGLEGGPASPRAPTSRADGGRGFSRALGVGAGLEQGRGGDGSHQGGPLRAHLGEEGEDEGPWEKGGERV